MSNPFALQVTPELMQRLVDPGERKPRKRPSRQQKSSAVAPLTRKEHDSDIQHVPSGAGVWPDPYFPPFGGPPGAFAGLFGGPPAHDTPAQPSSDLKKELAPVYKTLEESEQIAQRLQNQGEQELEKVQAMARDLQDKQYRAPSHVPPCTNERGSCIECYKENRNDPLLCSKFVEAFVACSRRAQEKFAASVSS